MFKLTRITQTVGKPLIEQVIAAELLESARIRRLKSRDMWAMTCSIISKKKTDSYSPGVWHVVVDAKIY